MDGTAVRRRDTIRLNDEVVPTRTVVLHLRPAPTAAEAELAERQRGARVTWDPQVREPENQQVSKSCCIFHKKKLFGESSSDSSSSSSSSDSDDDNVDGHRGAIPSGDGGAADHNKAGSSHTHDGYEHGCKHDHKPRKRRPTCTKDHCYCGTTFH